MTMNSDVNDRRDELAVIEWLIEEVEEIDGALGDAVAELQSAREMIGRLLPPSSQPGPAFDRAAPGPQRAARSAPPCAPTRPRTRAGAGAERGRALRSRAASCDVRVARSARAARPHPSERPPPGPRTGPNACQRVAAPERFRCWADYGYAARKRAWPHG